MQNPTKPLLEQEQGVEHYYGYGEGRRAFLKQLIHLNYLSCILYRFLSCLKTAKTGQHVEEMAEILWEFSLLLARELSTSGLILSHYKGELSTSGLSSSCQRNSKDLFAS